MTAPSGGTTTTAARYLRDTAKLMRERADAATQGSHYSLEPHCYCSDWDDEVECDHRPINWSLRIETPERAPAVSHELATRIHQQGDAEHIASWDPTVARAVADLLDMAAREWDAAVTACAVIDRTLTPEQLVGPAVAAALAVARAYRREVTS